jgi:AraC-like DNA-binding protein
MIFIIGISLAFFLEFLLISKKGKAKADIILAIWMFFIGLHLFLFYLQYSDLNSTYPVSIGLIFPLPLVHGPFLYFYVSTLTNQKPGNIYFQFIHFAPPFLMYLYLIHLYVLPASEKIAIMKSAGAGYQLFSIVNLTLIILSGIIYVAWTQILLLRHRKNIKERFSNIEKINLNWMQYLVWGIGFIWVVVLSAYLIFSGLLKTTGFNADIFIFTAVVLFVCLLGFFGLKQTNVFVAQTNRLQQIPETQSLVSAEKYAKSGLKVDDAEQLQIKLNEYMRLEKPYLNSDLSLSKLVERFNVHPNYLSQVINEKEEKNFYDYINTYRIEEFKRILTDPRKKNLTILALAFDCGFNSKSAFNKFFKKSTGQTPSDYIKLIK